jgi:hypothetical protein
MSEKQLGRMHKVELRQVWNSEAADFTPWLALEENLKLLGEAIGIELELEAQEKLVGPFRADILCKDTASDGWVLIENQLERTDHSHLGQLLTYASGLSAVTIIWIAERFTEEHRATLDWLNERTDEKINLFGLEIELWQIGSSPIAPKFNIVSQPNDWSRTVQQAASGSGEVTQHRMLQQKFWTAFRQYMEARKSFVRCQKPLPRHWTSHPIGRSGAHLSSVVSLWNSETNERGSEIRAELYLKGVNAKKEFFALEKQKDVIEQELGFTLGWHNPENAAMCKLYTRMDADFTNESLWPQQFEWLRERLEKLHTVFSPIMKKMKVEAEE